MIIWNEEFSKKFRVPNEIIQLVYAGVIEDMSWRYEPSPSFGTRLKDKNWVRLWVEHPDANERLGWDKRYTLVVQPDPSVPFGWKLVATDDVYEALTWLTEVLRTRGPRWRFKVQQGA